MLKNRINNNIFAITIRKVSNMIKLQIEKILHEKRITKTAFAEMLGIKKQNVNLLLETRNIDKIQEIADALGVDFNDLLSEKEVEVTPIVNGYVEVDSEIYPIKNREQFVALIDKVDGIVHIPLCARGENLKNNIESFYYKSINNAVSGAIMMRYGINEVFTLSYDSDSKKFSLTLCKGDGVTEFMTFDLAKYNQIKTPEIQGKNHLVDDIMDFIEAVYE